jgi:hypothetical protein
MVPRLNSNIRQHFILMVASYPAGPKPFFCPLLGADRKDKGIQGKLTHLQSEGLQFKKQKAGDRFQATRQSTAIKTRGFPPPPHDGFSFFRRPNQKAAKRTFSAWQPNLRRFRHPPTICFPPWKFGNHCSSKVKPSCFCQRLLIIPRQVSIFPGHRPLNSEMPFLVQKTAR